MKLKKVLATGLVATMVTSSSVMAFAASQTATGEGTGSVEGIVDTDVLNVVLPTVDTSTFDYIADPQGLIAKTDQAAYSGKTFGEGTLFFNNTATNKTYDYSNQSDSLTVVNKSAKALKLTVKAKAEVGSTGDEAALATSDTLSATDAEVYLAISDGTDTKVLSGTDTTITQVLGAAPADAYEYKYDDSTQEYSYSVKSDVSAYKFAEYSVYITGAASENGWTENTGVPKISVVWEADLAGDSDSVTVDTPAQTPTTYVSATTVSITSKTLTMTLPDSVTLSSIRITKTDSTELDWTLGTQYSVSGNTITIGDNAISNNVGATLTLKYSDGHTDTVSIQ